MFNFGVSLHVGTLLGEPESDAQALLQKEFENPQNLLAYLKWEGVTSIEVRNVRAHMPIERSVASIRTVHDAGLQVSVHIAFERLRNFVITSLLGFLLFQGWGNSLPWR